MHRKWIVLLFAVIIPLAARADINEDLLNAAKAGDADRVRALLDAEADVNAREDGHEYGNTPLIQAAWKGHTEVVRLLLAAGANIDLINGRPADALNYATEGGYPKIVRLLEEAEFKRVKSVTASSSMPDWGKYHYGPGMAFDGNRETAWVEGKNDSGIGEFIELSLNRDMTIDTIGVMPGFFVERYFKTNNRVKKLKVRAGDSVIDISFRDEMTLQRFQLPSRITFNKIVFEISDVHRGKDPDTCIAELEFYLQGKRILIEIPGKTDAAVKTGVPGQTIAETTYYKIDLSDKAAKAAFRSQYMISEYDIPKILVYREAIRLNALTVISEKEFEHSRNRYCEGRCFFVRVTPDANGHVKTIMTSFDHRASTGVITKTYTFGENGLLSKMSVESQVAHYKPVKIERVSPDQLVLTEEFTYFQGGAGAEVTVKHSIQHNEAYEIIDYKSDVKTKDIGQGR